MIWSRVFLLKFIQALTLYALCAVVMFSIAWPNSALAQDARVSNARVSYNEERNEIIIQRNNRHTSAGQLESGLPESFLLSLNPFAPRHIRVIFVSQPEGADILVNGRDTGIKTRADLDVDHRVLSTFSMAVPGYNRCNYEQFQVEEDSNPIVIYCALTR